VIICINDISIYSKSEAGHVKHLRIVLQRLCDERLYAKFSKCYFLLDSISFLGHMVIKDSIMVDSSKIIAIRD